MRIAFVGGGTGGHFYPLIAVAEVLREQREAPELYYIGPTPYDAAALAAHGIAHVRCPAGKLRRYASVQNFFDIFKNLAGLFVALVKLYIIYPDVVFSKGGYTSVPVLLAARFLRIPVVIHESDSVPGRANKLARSFARYVAVSYDDAAQYFPAEKTALTGIPIRRAIRTPHPDPWGTLGIPSDRPLLFVTGGSLGSERINNLILEALPTLLPHYRIFHQTGPTHEALVKTSAQAVVADPALLSGYYVVGTAPAAVVAAAQTAASLIISRAGSTTLAEIALHGKPSIVIPISEAVSHDQRTNAYAYARTGAATVLEEDNLTAHLLENEIRSIMGDATRYQHMGEAARRFAPTDAAEKIAALLITIGKEHGS